MEAFLFGCMSILVVVLIVWNLKPPKQQPLCLSIDIETLLNRQELRMAVLDFKMAQFHTARFELDELEGFDRGDVLHNWAIDQGFTNAEIMDSSDRILKELDALL